MILIILFQNILFSKGFLACNGYLGYLPKLKRGLGLAFGAHFLHDLSNNQWTEFQCHTFFPSQDIKQDVLLSSYLDSQ